MEPTWILLMLLEGLVDVDEGKVVSFWVLELHVAAVCLCFQLPRRVNEARWY